MSQLLWGQVYYKETLAGQLQELSGGRMSFTYELDYLNSNNPAIAHTLALQEEGYVCEQNLHPFFDNLVAEGWLEHAQTRLLGKRQASRFELLLAFGYDCAGAVSIRDPELAPLSKLMLDKNNAKEQALLSSRSSLSGIQPKLTLIQKGKSYAITQGQELSTHLAKFPSQNHPNLIENEYLTTLAFKALLPKDSCVEVSIETIPGFDEPALIIKRFDRRDNERIHFEEFNQLLNLKSTAKYNGAYKDMADFLQSTQNGPAILMYRLYARILAGILLGNTDMHLKNLALFHNHGQLTLTPSYDQVNAAIYDYKHMALTTATISNIALAKLKAKHIIFLGQEFALSPDIILEIVQTLYERLDDAKTAISKSEIGSDSLKSKLITTLEKRWNGTFALIGQTLSKMQ